MGQKEKNKFDSKDVEWILDQFSMVKSKFFNKLTATFMAKMNKMINYIQKPLLKLIKVFAGRLLRFFGLELPVYEVVRLKEYLIPTSLGGKLATDIYLPKPVYQDRYKAPTILIRLPYWKDMVSILGYFLASMGYVTVLQDTRGCAHSKPYGTNSFLMFEGYDGVDTVRWISKRFWYNNRLGMWGMSYFGITQLAIAAAMSEEDKDLVTCLNPGMASYHNIFYHPYGLVPLGMGASVYCVFNSITKYYELESIVGMFEDEWKIPQRLSKYPLLNLYNEKIGEKSYILHFDDLSKLEDPAKIIATINEKIGLDLRVGEEDKGEFRKLLKAVTYDRTVNPQSLLFPHAIGFDFKPTIPMLVIAGHYDMFQEEFMRDLKAIQKAAPDYFKTNYKVVIGPWAHGGMDMAFNDKGYMSTRLHMKDLIEMARIFMPMWYFNYFLKKGKKDISKIPPLQIYILNRKIWRYFKSWPPKTTPLKLYLHSNGKANSRFGDGVLSEQEPKDEPQDEYVFDPANPVVTKGGRHLFFVSGPHDQSKIEERSDVLVYTSEKLTEGIEIIGEVKVILYAASSAKDTDFMAKLVDVSPNGKKAINILDDGVRARYREGDLKNPTLIEPGKVYKYEINLGNIAVYFPKNHRIRLEISSSNFPKFDINSNLAGEQNEKDYITANQKIYHNSQYPSHILLPLFKKD
ncbi:MAG: CocE/NonD family hydrolase [Candidatus Helarchaeota archaeon]